MWKLFNKNYKPTQINNMTKDNQELLKLCVQMQQNQRWGMVRDCVIIALAVIPNLYMIWQNYKKNRLSPKQRLRRNRAAQARLKLDEQEILKEAIHEEELKKMETGLEDEENQDLANWLNQLRKQNKKK